MPRTPTVPKVEQDILGPVLGRWWDERYSEYEVVRESNTSCIVKTTRPDGSKINTPGLIRIGDPASQWANRVIWGKGPRPNYKLDETCITENYIVWESLLGGLAFNWKRGDLVKRPGASAAACKAPIVSAAAKAPAISKASCAAPARTAPTPAPWKACGRHQDNFADGEERDSADDDHFQKPGSHNVDHVSIPEPQVSAESSSKHVMQVLKHSCMGCALVTLSSPADVQRLLSSSTKIDLAHNVQADIRQHVDKSTQALCEDRVFLAWGRQQDIRNPISEETIVAILEESLSGSKSKEITLDKMDGKAMEQRADLTSLSVDDSTTDGECSSGPSSSTCAEPCAPPAPATVPEMPAVPSQPSREPPSEDELLHPSMRQAASSSSCWSCDRLPSPLAPLVSSLPREAPSMDKVHTASATQVAMRFHDITGLDIDQATQLLELHGWNLEEAIRAHVSDGPLTLSRSAVIEEDTTEQPGHGSDEMLPPPPPRSSDPAAGDVSAAQVDVADAIESASKVQRLAVGDDVCAFFYGQWFKAKIRQLGSDDHVEVLWDDGSVTRLWEGNIARCSSERACVGDAVIACFYGGWHPARIRQLLPEEWVEVMWEDGSVTDVPPHHVFHRLSNSSPEKSSS